MLFVFHYGCILYRDIGNIIVPMLDSAEVQKIKKDDKTQSKIDDVYSQLDKFYPLLKEIREKKNQ